VTLQAEATKAVAAERYKIAAVTADQRYWDNRRAAEQQQQSAEHARTEAAHNASLPVIVSGVVSQQPAEQVVTVARNPCAIWRRWNICSR
jgi:hypothetical protein